MASIVRFASSLFVHSWGNQPKEITNVATERLRRQRLAEINTQPSSHEVLEAQYGQVSAKEELIRDALAVFGFVARWRGAGDDARARRGGGRYSDVLWRIVADAHETE